MTQPEPVIKARLEFSASQMQIDRVLYFLRLLNLRYQYHAEKEAAPHDPGR